MGPSLPAPFQGGGLALGLSRPRLQVPVGGRHPSRHHPCPNLFEVAQLRCSRELQPTAPVAPGHLLVPMNDGIEEAAVTPAGSEVVTVQALVALHHALRPQQQLLFGRHVLRLPAHLDVRDLPHTAGRRQDLSHIPRLAPLTSRPSTREPPGQLRHSEASGGPSRIRGATGTPIPQCHRPRPLQPAAATEVRAPRPHCHHMVGTLGTSLG